MPSYYLKVYEDNKQKKKLERFDFNHKEEFVSWNDRNKKGKWMNDEVSSMKFRLPNGWAVRFYKHRDPNKKGDDRTKKFYGDEKKVKINQSDFHSSLNDELSAHEFVKV